MKQSLSSKLKTARDWHIYYVFHDEEFIENIMGIGRQPSRKNLERISHEFSIPYDETENYYRLAHSKIASRPIIPFQTSSMHSSILDFAIDSKTGKPVSYLFKKPRRRAPQETLLIYCIFKARIKDKKYSSIFDLYSKGELPGYKGSTNQFLTSDSLKAYYQQYRPDNRKSIT